MNERLHFTLIAAPRLSFAELREQLAGLGWRLESASEAPILPGEPELAVFVQSEDATVIHYTFNPVVMLRVLQFRGANAEAHRLHAGRNIPVVGVNDLHAWLDSNDIRLLLLGLFATEVLGEIKVTGQVTRLCAHSEDKVARTAVRVRDSLLGSAAGYVADQVRAEQALHPERSAWFSHLPQPELRKQVLRWLMHDEKSSNQNIDQVLYSALKDSDPEVRVTAVLAAAKLRATNLIPAIREADIPTSSRLGADERDRLFYARLRQTAIGYLAIDDRAENDQIGERRLQFQKAVSGELEVRDDSTLLLYSLATPVQLGGKPATLPGAIEERDGNYCLRRSGLAMRWVAPIPHWLGEDSKRAPFPNPIRRVTPQSGFFIAEIPIGSAIALWTSDPKQSPPGGGGSDTTQFVCGYDEAEHLCELLSELEGERLEVPAADQWEMAVRGPDGRRYSWGNSLREGGYLQPSPWLVKNMAGQVGEWTGDRDNTGRHIVCGGLKSPACARRQAVGDREAQCVVRPVMMWAGK